ncbi:MAG TPA: hypothetical protein VE995_06655 [Gaiellaceae bacterium]|nr:hypothetical protein [Gaiellaceae bacterium]
MDVGGEVAGVTSNAPGAISRRQRLWVGLVTAVVWLGGSAVVALAQPTHDRRLAAVGAAAAGIAVILVLSGLSADTERGHLRALVGSTIAVSLTAEWLLWHLHASASGFVIDGLVKRIVLPLLIVLPAPLVARRLWERRAALSRGPRGMDWIVGAYATVVLLPALAVGLVDHNRLLYIAQDLGLIVFFAFTYLAGRSVTAAAARASGAEFVDALLLLAAAKWILFGWEIFPIYSYAEAACAGAIAVLLLRPRAARLLPIGLAVVLLALDVVQVRQGSNSSTALEFAGAIAVLAYVLARIRPALPRWLLVAAAVGAVVVVVGFTADGAAIRGQYHGPDPSNAGRTYEARRVRATVRRSPVSLVLGRGLGGTINETHAPPVFKRTLIYGGRDLAHVQEVHLLVYAFLLKAGFLGIVWLAAFVLGLAAVVVRGLERAARTRDPSLVLYVALPLLGAAQAFGAASRLQADPLNGLALGILVSCLAAPLAERARGQAPALLRRDAWASAEP